VPLAPRWAGQITVILVVTLTNGGTVTSSGFWLGLIFIGLGAGRLYLALRRT